MGAIVDRVPTKGILTVQWIREGRDPRMDCGGEVERNERGGE